MLTKLKSHLTKENLDNLRDVRVLGLGVFVFLVLLVSWSGIKSIQTNYELQKKISGLQQEVEVLELENANAELRNRYLETDQYLELSARRQFGKAKPGETLVLVPREVALKNSVSEKKLSSQSTKQVKKSKYQRNFEAWMGFFFPNLQSS